MKRSKTCFPRNPRVFRKKMEMSFGNGVYLCTWFVIKTSGEKVGFDRSVLLLLRFPLYFIDLTFKSSSLSEGKKMTSQRWLQEWVKANNCWQLSRRLHSWEHITLMEVISDNHSLVQIRYKHQTLLRSHYTNLCIVFLTVHSYKY